MKKAIGLILGLTPLNTNAECVPVPDCASIGYTETSCDGDSLKCPFDSSKLKCFPCDSSFRFSCDGENVVSTIGDACNNKYTACNCIAGATFVNGECICDTSCSVGNIYYSDKTCSSCLIADKTVIGVVVKDKQLITTINYPTMIWSPDDVDIPEIINLANQPEVAKKSMTGAADTLAIVKHYGAAAENVAAVYCYNYAPEEMPETKNKWYMPAAGEINQYFYKNYNTVSKTFAILGANFNQTFTTTSEIGGGAVWVSYSTLDQVNFDYKKTGKRKVACLLAIN